MKNWWSGTVRAKFHELEALFDAQYSRFPIADGLYQDFNGDMQKAMADYAGISVILDIAGSDPVPGRKYSKRLRLMCLRA